MAWPSARSLRRTAAAAILLPLAALALYAGGADPPLIRALESQTLQWRYRLRGPLAPSGAVALVMIDDRTLDAFGQWPLSRSHLAEAVRALAEDGARVVAFDLLFPEPEAGLSTDVTEVLTDARARLDAGAGDLTGRIDRLLTRGAPDRALASAMAEAGMVLLPFAFTFDGGPTVGGAAPPAVTDAAFRVHSRPAGMVRPPPVHPAAILAPTPALSTAAAALAHVTVLLEQDGALRYDQTAIAFGGDFYPSLPIEAVRLYDGVSKEDAALRLGRGIALGDRFVETDRRMRLAVNHYGPAGTIRTYSLIDLVRGDLPKGVFAGRIVLIAASADGIGDTFSSPFTRTLPGAEHFATAIDNILTGRALTGHDRPTAADAAAIVLGGLAAALIGRFLAPIPATAAVALLIAGWFGVASYLFTAAHAWLAVAWPTVTAALNFGIFGAVRLTADRKLRRRIERQRANLTRYFSPAVAERLMDSDRPGVADRTQHAAILFIDLVGFTAVSERLAPAEAMDLLRRFYRLVETEIHDRGGVLDKFLGDGALAVFGMPEPSADDARNALAAARRLAAGMAEWQGERWAAGEAALAVGIGLHYGPVLIGDAGGERQFSFTVIGDAVNTASRLEGLTRSLDVTIIASDALMDAARATGGQKVAAGFSPLPMQRLRGRRRPIGVWGWREGGAGGFDQDPADDVTALHG